MNKKIIELRDVSFVYDSENAPGVKALDEVSLDIYEGEFVGIVGKNGSGKSTLAKLLNALILPSSGKVFVGGMDSADPQYTTDIRKVCSMVFQNPDNQMVATIVEEDTAFGPENLGLAPDKIRRRVDESLKAVGMYDFKDKKPHQLSGGQKQRVAIAGVIAMHPQCIVFDESTAMLDPAGRADLINIMHTLNSEGVTVIFITHYMEEIVGASRIIVMGDGKIIGDGTPREIFSNPKWLEENRLSVPEIVALSTALREGGLDIPPGILSEDELVEALCRLK
ncbi:MAG: energy-coupling factor transporter ATPase [Eubacteriaceae bacterium]|nr:energy-coupling factor transporter ATPase [Eubacteriaceae bacterium]